MVSKLKAKFLENLDEEFKFTCQLKWYGLVTKPIWAAKTVLQMSTIKDFYWETFTRKYLRLLMPYSRDGMLSKLKEADKIITALPDYYPHRMMWVIGWYSVLAAWYLFAFCLNVVIEIWVAYRDYVRSWAQTNMSGGLKGCVNRIRVFGLKWHERFSIAYGFISRKLNRLWLDGEFGIFIKRVVLGTFLISALVIAFAFIIFYKFNINIFSYSGWLEHDLVENKQPAEVVYKAKAISYTGANKMYWYSWFKLHDDSFWFYDTKSEPVLNITDAEENIGEVWAPFLFGFIVYLGLIFFSGEYFDGKFMRREVSKWWKEKEIDERLQDEGSDGDTPEQAVNKEEGHGVYAADAFKDLQIANWKKLFTKKQIEAIVKEYTFTRTQTKWDRLRDHRSVDEVMENYEKSQEILKDLRKGRGNRRGPNVKFSAPYDPNWKSRKASKK